MDDAIYIIFSLYSFKLLIKQIMCFIFVWTYVIVRSQYSLLTARIDLYIYSKNGYQ